MFLHFKNFILFQVPPSSQEQERIFPKEEEILPQVSFPASLQTYASHSKSNQWPKFSCGQHWGLGGGEWKEEILSRYPLVSSLQNGYMGRVQGVVASVTHAKDKTLH